MAHMRQFDSVRETSPRVAVITPSRAQAYAVCPYRFTYDDKSIDVTSRSLQMGQWIHALIRDYNLARIRGTEPVLDDIIARNAPPALFLDGGDEEDHVIEVGLANLTGYRAFLELQGFTSILAAERYIRTPARPIAGLPGCSIVFAGRCDVVVSRAAPERHVAHPSDAAGRDDADRCLHAVTCLDVKTGNSPLPSNAQVAEAPSSFVYRHLLSYAFSAVGDCRLDIEIMLVNPVTGQWARARLTDDQIEAGKAVCRDMAKTMCGHTAPTPQPGEWCAYCGLIAHCPAHQISRAGWDTPF